TGRIATHLQITGRFSLSNRRMAAENKIRPRIAGEPVWQMAGHVLAGCAGIGNADSGREKDCPVARRAGAGRCRTASSRRYWIRPPKSRRRGLKSHFEINSRNASSGFLFVNVELTLPTFRRRLTHNRIGMASKRNEAQTRFELIDPALETRGWLRTDIRIEVTAAQIDIIDGKPRCRPAGRTDYILRRP